MTRASRGFGGRAAAAGSRCSVCTSVVLGSVVIRKQQRFARLGRNWTAGLKATEAGEASRHRRTGLIHKNLLSTENQAKTTLIFSLPAPEGSLLSANTSETPQTGTPSVRPRGPSRAGSHQGVRFGHPSSGCTGGSDSWKIPEEDVQKISRRRRKVGHKEEKRTGLLSPGHVVEHGVPEVLIKADGSVPRQVAGCWGSSCDSIWSSQVYVPTLQPIAVSLEPTAHTPGSHHRLPVQWGPEPEGHPMPRATRTVPGAASHQGRRWDPSHLSRPTCKHSLRSRRGTV